uniref:Synaptonemal complex protein 2 n=1 Tax=Bos mutus grunniens TaxID=30521 RepID=A0A8B9YMU8_BOSMU
MPIRPDLQQLEKCIDDALRKNDFKPLKTLLQIDICEDVKIKCSKQFFHKLDDLMCRELNKRDIQTVSTILVSFGRCGKNITILGQAGLLTMIKQGLVQKISIEYEIILSRGNSKDEAVINMIEDIFDLLMVSHYLTLKKMNVMLDRMPQDARKILCNQQMLILMSSMGERILDAGDYDLQAGIVEALCRMTTEKQRRELACQWFSMDFIADAFKGIKDSEFETDCRIFLNLVNGMLGDKRRVFTFPCLSAFLDKYELQIPSDEKLEEFWVDFNLGSQTLSFYIAGDNDDHQWEAVTVPEEKVQIYSIEVRESKKLLTVILKNIVKISKREGKELLLYFDASLEITNVAQKIFGGSKYKEFTRKQGISVAKTSVHILFDASGSQILVPESQLSPVEEEHTSLKETANLQEEFTKPAKYIKNSNQGYRKNSQPEIITPSKRKMSEASMIVPGADRYTVRSPILLVNTSSPRKRRIKPPLQMMSSTEKPSVSKTSEQGVDYAVSLKSRPSEEKKRRDNTDKEIVLDSQAAGRIDKPVLPDVLDSTCGDKMHSKWACWTPVTNIKLCNNQRASTSSRDTFNQDIVINQKLPKQKSSSSISDDNSEETEKVQYRKEIMQRNRTDKAEADDCHRNRQQPGHSTHSEEKSIENAKQSDWCIESETTFKSVLLNKTVEESVIYKKKYVLSKDVNTDTCDQSPSPQKNAKSRRKSGRRLTAEFNSWDLKQKNTREKSKGKGFTDAAESLINQINKRYQPKDSIQSARKSKESLIDRKILLYNGVNVSLHFYRDDVYNFNLSGADEPVIKLGVSWKSEVILYLFSIYFIFTIQLLEYKNPFSDSDTEYRCDDSKTDISWLREPKSKPLMMDYSRNKNVKKHKNGKKSSKKSLFIIVDETVAYGRTRLPRRAAKTKKNYKDLSNSESEGEQEFSCSFKEKVLVQEKIHSRSKTMKLPKKQQNSFTAKTQKDVSKEWKISSLLKNAGRDNSLDPSPVSLSGSPSSIEVMRCVEKITERDFTQDCDCVAESPDPKTSSPESLNSGVGGPIKSSKNSEKNLLCTRESSSIADSLPSEPPGKPNCNSYSDKSHSASPLSTSSEEREKTWYGMPSDSTHMSGCIQHLSRKRMYTEDSLNNSGEVEEERANLLPKKLCKSKDADHHTYKGR